MIDRLWPSKPQAYIPTKPVGNHTPQIQLVDIKDLYDVLGGLPIPISRHGAASDGGDAKAGDFFDDEEEEPFEQEPWQNAGY